MLLCAQASLRLRRKTQRGIRYYTYLPFNNYPFVFPLKGETPHARYFVVNQISFSLRLPTFPYLYPHTDFIMSTRRQQKVSSLIQEELSGIFQKHGATYYGSAFVTITGVEVSPDLLVTKIFLSIYNVKDKEKTLDTIISNTHEIRRHLGNKMRFHLRRIPELLFYIDDSIENAMRVNELLNKVNKDSESKN